MDKILLAVFITALIPFLLYPAYILLSIVFRKKAKKIPSGDTNVAPVSIIIVGYNEQRYIRNKIQSFLNPAEWIPGSEIIVVSGGSTDGTPAIIREFENTPDVKVFLFEQRVAKIDGVNLAVSHAKNEILVFSDCRQVMKPGSVRKLVSRFSDETIGTVSATLMDHSMEGNSSLIRSMLNEVAFRDSASGSALNVFGALYAQRKSVYRTIPRDILFDDLFVTVSTIEQGKRLVQEREAVIYDVPFDAYYGSERIERLARGLLVFFRLHKNTVRKLSPSVRARFIVYKYLKLFIPFLLPVILLSGIGVADVFVPPLFQVTFIALLAVSTLIPEIRQFIALYIRVNYYFAIAVLKFYFRNERSITWAKLEVMETDSKTAA